MVFSILFVIITFQLGVEARGDAGLKEVSTQVKADEAATFQSALAHEYGHVAFYERILQEVPELAPTLESVIDHKTVVSLNRAINLPAKSDHANPVDVERVAYRVMSRVEKKMPPDLAKAHWRILSIFAPYNEHFADLVQEISSRKALKFKPLTVGRGEKRFTWR